jgi:hypothetical protein
MVSLAGGRLVRAPEMRVRAACLKGYSGNKRTALRPAADTTCECAGKISGA